MLSYAHIVIYTLSDIINTYWDSSFNSLGTLTQIWFKFKLQVTSGVQESNRMQSLFARC